MTNNTRLKFRAFNKKTNVMLDLQKITQFALDPSLKLDSILIPFEDDLIIMQCSGLTDKNGKDIFEGDILLVPDEGTDIISPEFGGPTEPCNHLAPVIFKNGGFGIYIEDAGNFYEKGFNSFDYLISDIGESFIIQEEIEIIGNIHQNHELIKEQTDEMA